MTISSRSASLPLRPFSVVALVAVTVGAVVLLASFALDWGGFWGGAVQGAALGVLGFGLYLWGYTNGLRRGGLRSAWLPSKDAAE